MKEILAQLQSIVPLVSKTSIRQMSQVIFGMLVITGRVTMLGLSRWTDKGGKLSNDSAFLSYCTTLGRHDVDNLCETSMESRR